MPYGMKTVKVCCNFGVSVSKCKTSIILLIRGMDPYHLWFDAQ